MPVYNDALKGYRDFHGHDPRWEKEERFHVPKNLVVLGRAVSIEYKTDKLNGGGDGKMAIYHHKFTTPSYVCMDETGKHQLIITGKKLKVSKAGIEN